MMRAGLWIWIAAGLIAMSGCAPEPMMEPAPVLEEPFSGLSDERCDVAMPGEGDGIGGTGCGID